jgi:divalent metal cation (Fe/Co/Zn/Cd) transporter
VNFASWLVVALVILALAFLIGAGWVAHESHGNSPAILPLAIGFAVCAIVVGALAVNNSAQWLGKYGSTLARRRDRY